MLFLAGCCAESLKTIVQVADMLEEKFDFQFPRETELQYAELFFSKRSSTASVYMKLKMSEESFQTFKTELSDRMTELGLADWGDQKVRDELDWWDAHQLNHDREYAISDVEDPRMQHSRIFFSTRKSGSSLVEIYLVSQWDASI